MKALEINVPLKEDNLKLSLPLILLYTAIPTLLDFLYPLKSVMLLLFSLYLVLLLWYIISLNYKRVLWLFLFMICMLDDGPRSLYEFQESEFYSLLEPLFGPLSLFHLTLGLFVLGIFIVLFRTNKIKLHVPMLLIFAALVLIGLVGFLLFQKEDAPVLNNLSLRYLMCMLAFIIPFIYAHNAKIEKKELLWLGRHLIMFCIGKVLCSLVLLAIGRFSFWGGIIMTTSPAFQVAETLMVYILYLMIKRKHGWLLLFISSLFIFETARRFQRSVMLNFLWYGTVMFFMVVMRNRFNSFVIKYVPAILVVVFLLIGIFINYSEQLVVIQQFEEEFEGISAAGSGDENDVRVLEWKNTIAELSENPYSLLFGAGMNNLVEFETYKYYKEFSSSDFTKEMIASGHYYPHSFFNVLTLKTGLIGFLLYIILAILLCYPVFQMSRTVEYGSSLQFFVALLFTSAFAVIWTMPCSLMVSIANGPIWGLVFANRHLFQKQN